MAFHVLATVAYFISAAAAAPAPAALAELDVSSFPPQNPLAYCTPLLNGGLWDETSVEVNQANYSMTQATVCSSRYGTAASAKQLKAGGGIDIFDVLGLSGSDAQSESSYQQAWKNFCGASLADIRNNAGYTATFKRASTVIAHSFRDCIVALADRTVRFIKPTPEGSGFTIYIETHSDGAHDLHVLAIDILDNETTEHLNPVKQCFRNGAPIELPIDSDHSNQIGILCSKTKDHSVSVRVTSDAGDLPTVDVPASPPAPPSVLDRLSAIEGELSKFATSSELTGSIAVVNAAIATANGRIGGAESGINAIGNNNTCAWTAWIKKDIPLLSQPTCPANQYVRGVQFTHAGGENYTHQESVSVECCPFR
jgi:hypothetical protein